MRTAVGNLRRLYADALGERPTAAAEVLWPAVVAARRLAALIAALAAKPTRV